MRKIAPNEGSTKTNSKIVYSNKPRQQPIMLMRCASDGVHPVNVSVLDESCATTLYKIKYKESQ